MKITINTQKLTENILKKEAIKLALILNIIKKARGEYEYHWMKFYPDLELEKGLVCDLYFENIKKKIVIIYKIETRRKQSKEVRKRLEDFETEFLKKVFFIRIDDFPDDLNEIKKKVEDLI